MPSAHQAVGALYVLQPEIHGCPALLKRGKPRGSIVGSPPLSRVPAIKLQQFPTTVGGALEAAGTGECEGESAAVVLSFLRDLRHTPMQGLAMSQRGQSQRDHTCL